MSLRAVFARNLRRLRQSQNLSQEELAHRANISANYISLLENADYAATLDMVERLAEALSVSPGLLLDPSTDPT